MGHPHDTGLDEPRGARQHRGVFAGAVGGNPSFDVWNAILIGQDVRLREIRKKFLGEAKFIAVGIELRMDFAIALNRRSYYKVGSWLGLMASTIAGQ